LREGIVEAEWCWEVEAEEEELVLMLEEGLEDLLRPWRTDLRTAGRLSNGDIEKLDWWRYAEVATVGGRWEKEVETVGPELEESVEEVEEVEGCRGLLVEEPVVISMAERWSRCDWFLRSPSSWPRKPPLFAPSCSPRKLGKPSGRTGLKSQLAELA
jgi:hypothetical protein